MSHLVIIAGAFSLGIICGVTYLVAAVARSCLSGNFEPPSFFKE